MADLLTPLATFLVGYGLGFWTVRIEAAEKKERQELIDRIMESEFRAPLAPSDDRDEWRGEGGISK